MTVRDTFEFDPAALLEGVQCPHCRAMSSCYVSGKCDIGKTATCADCGHNDIIVGQTFSWDLDGEQRGCRNIVWHITSLLMHLREHPRRSITMPFHVIEHMAENNSIPDWYMSHDFAMATDLSEPVVAIANPRGMLFIENDMVCPVLVVDGWNRVYKAWKTKQPLKAFMLTPDEEQLFRIKDTITL